jgi:hypothetical protein
VYCLHRDHRHRSISSVRPHIQPIHVAYLVFVRYVLGVRVEGDGLYIKKIETLVSDAGDWLFNATGTAYWNARETWDVIPLEQRDTRDVIKAAGDAYFDRFGNANVSVPFGIVL